MTWVEGIYTMTPNGIQAARGYEPGDRMLVSDELLANYDPVAMAYGEGLLRIETIPRPELWRECPDAFISEPKTRVFEFLRYLPLLEGER